MIGELIRESISLGTAEAAERCKIGNSNCVLLLRVRAQAATYGTRLIPYFKRSTWLNIRRGARILCYDIGFE
jgi:hypothetical protein